MSRARLALMDVVELVRLHRLGYGGRRVAELLRVSPNTERMYRQWLNDAGLLAGDAQELPSEEILRAALEAARPPKVAAQQVSSAEAYSGEIRALWDAGVGPRAIWDRLRVRHGSSFRVSLSAIKRHCGRLTRERGVRAEDVKIHVDTEPGEVAQVDFGSVGLLFDPASQLMRKAYVFVLVLGYSRKMWAKLVFDQSAETWVSLHVQAFEALGGVPRTLVPDNLKAAVIAAAFGCDRDQLTLNRSYRELARHYGFCIDPAPPRAPQKKGKVESAVSYVRHNFLAGRTELDVTRVQADLDVWLAEVAGNRVHGTTGKQPDRVFIEVEKQALLPLPVNRFEAVIWRRARVHPDSHISVERVLYSVPFVHIGKEVWVKLLGTRLTVYLDEVRIADHVRRDRGRSTCDAHLPEYRADLRHRSRSYWQERAAVIGPDTAAFVGAVFDSDDVVSQLRPVQAIVCHLEQFPKQRAEAACRRANAHGAYTYRAVVAILRKALDLDEIPQNPPPIGALDQPRFARNPANFGYYPPGGTA